MKIIYLLPPSEGKNLGGEGGKEKLSFCLEKPLDIASNATEKDLKCTGKRYEEGIFLNNNIHKAKFLPAIERYSGVMYNAIDYSGMSERGKKYFEENFFIFSGMYGILRPTDLIGNYKLPIETKGLVKFWDTKITDALNSIGADYIVDLLPNSYKKMVQWKKLQANILKIDFYKDSPLLGGERLGVRSKMTHGVKKVKGVYIHNICEKEVGDIQDFGEKIVQISENQYHLSVIIK